MTQSPQPFRTTNPMTRIREDLTTAQIGAVVRLGVRGTRKGHGHQRHPSRAE
ncbi:hypothetical protein A6R68_19850 [Neotoma lepida]|uniref:Uncharacterized protein n=1 Tax=Neotoma lepida TaxID=56216 RepID=A0A1A6HHM0_NEOLE|nr:hypothetical protein A6R68_19850 [Neotoma lepida]